MRNSVLPVMGVLTVVAGAIGLQLGESAIAQIDPTYFQGAAVPPEDVSRKGPRRPAPGFAQASGWAQGYAARAADCGDCPALLTRQTHAPAFAAPAYSAPAYVDATIAPRWERADESLVLASRAEDIAPAPEPRRIDRYLHYRVSGDEPQTARSLARPEIARPEVARTLRPEPEMAPAADPVSQEPVGL